jgi:hypothetical protein
MHTCKGHKKCDIWITVISVNIGADTGIFTKTPLGDDSEMGV